MIRDEGDAIDVLPGRPFQYGKRKRLGNTDSIVGNERRWHWSRILLAAESDHFDGR